MSQLNGRDDGAFGSELIYWQNEPESGHVGPPLQFIAVDSQDVGPPLHHNYHDNYHGTEVVEAESSSNNNPYTISSLFVPSLLVDGRLPDVFLCSSDMVLFYAHIPVLLDASHTHFGGWLMPESIISASSEYPLAIYTIEPSHVLSLALCLVYGCELPVPHPSLHLIEQSISALITYGISPKTVLTPKEPIYTLLRSHFERHALEVFAFAAQYDIQTLASEASVHLLGYPFIHIPDDIAKKIGGVYMHRLGNLQIHRVEEFKRILLEKPKSHTPTLSCGTKQQAALMRSYTLSVAYMAWDARPDFPVTQIQDSVLNLGMKLSCADCRASLSTHLKEIVTKWLVVKRCI